MVEGRSGWWRVDLGGVDRVDFPLRLKVYDRRRSTVVPSRPLPPHSLTPGSEPPSRRPPSPDDPNTCVRVWAVRLGVVSVTFILYLDPGVTSDL